MPLAPASRQKKYGQVSDQIHAMALNLGADSRLPTVTQLRDTLGVSIATLDSALRDLEERNIIRRKHGAGIFVASHIKKPIALIMNMNHFARSNASPFWSILLEELRKRTAQWSETVRFFASFENSDSEAPMSEALLESVRQGKIQGIIAVGIPIGISRQLIALELPHVVYAGYGACAVAHDSGALIRLGVEELLAQGCRRIEVWSHVEASQSVTVVAENAGFRSEIFRRTLNENGLPDTPARIRFDTGQTTRKEAGLPTLSYQEQGFQIAEEAFGGGEPPPDGIVMTDDMMTFGALASLRKRGVEIGRDLRIATHANKGSSILMGYEEQITRLEFDPAELVETMFQNLEDWMRDKTVPAQTTWIQPHLRRGNDAL